jgi:CHAT domain-containing protein
MTLCLMPLAAWAQQGDPETWASRDLWAIVIGVGQYEDPLISDLPYAKADAEAVYAYLTDSEEGSFPPHHVHLLLDEQVTWPAICSAFSWLRNVADEEDIVVIYFSGHGASNADDDGDGMDGYLIPHDAKSPYLFSTALCDDEFGYWLSHIQAKSVLVILEASFTSGGASKYTPSLSRPSTYASYDLLAELGGESHLILAAGEPSYYDVSMGHGVFTYFLLRALGALGEGRRDADANQDGRVTVAELSEYLSVEVPTHTGKMYGFSQHPIIIGELRGACFLGSGYQKPLAATAVIPVLGERKGGEKAAEANQLLDEANVAYNQANYYRAIDLYEEALTVCQEIGDRSGEAQSLNNLGICHHSLAEYAQAIDCHQQSLDIFQQIGDRQGEAQSLNNLGICHHSLAEYAQAIDCHQQSLAIFQQIGDRQGEAQSLNNLGICHHSLAEYAQAIDCHQQSLAIFQQIGDRQGEAASLGNLGLCYCSLGDYHKAIDYHDESLELERQIGNRGGEARSLGNLGESYRLLGDYVKAIEDYEESLAIFQEIGDRQGEAVSLDNLGVCYEALGDYKQAIDYHEKSLAIFREIGDREGEANDLDNLGNCHYSFGDYRKAIDYHEESLAIDREIGAHNGELWSLNALGECYRKLGKIDRAMDYYNQTLAIAQDIGARLGEATALDSLGNCYREKGEYKKAFDYYGVSQAILRAICYRRGQAEGLADLAECCLDAGDYQQAIAHYQQALTISVDIGTVGTKWKAQWGLGKAYWKQGKLDSAKTYYEQAIAEVEGIRSRIKVDKLEQSYTASVRALYEEYIELLLEMGKGKDTISAEERSRARAFLNALTANPAGISKRTIEAGIANGIDSAAIENTVQSVVEESSEDSAILEYLVTNQGTLVWVIRGGEQQGPYKIPHNYKELMDKVIECRQQIEGLNPMANFNLAILYDWLIRPIEDLLPAADADNPANLIIVPSGPLYYLPFQALMWTSSDLNEHSYFIERYVLSYSPSLTMIKYGQLPNEQSASKSVFVALANPNPDPDNPKLRLPEAEQEAYRVASCFPVAKVHVGEDANEDVLGSAAVGTQSILFAAHGIFDPNNPMYSYIALSPTENTDGRLHAYDVFSLSLDTDTVVLSACETLLPAVKNLEQQIADVAAKTGSQPGSITTDQLATITAGDDIVGLTRAFLVAGASSVISSLWNVDSHAAGQFMISFYHHLEDDGMTKAEALRAASLDIMHTPNTNWYLPCYWAPFELIGGWQ